MFGNFRTDELKFVFMSKEVTECHRSHCGMSFDENFFDLMIMITPFGIKLYEK